MPNFYNSGYPDDDAKNRQRNLIAEIMAAQALGIPLAALPEIGPRPDEALPADPDTSVNVDTASMTDATGPALGYGMGTGMASSQVGGVNVDAAAGPAVAANAGTYGGNIAAAKFAELIAWARGCGIDRGVRKVARPGEREAVRRGLSGICDDLAKQSDS